MIGIAILDYGVGNLRSVANAVAAAGGNPLVTGDPDEALRLPGLVVPGVGAFPHVMKQLLSSGLDEVVRIRVRRDQPVLGICVGMQLLFEEGFEFAPTRGLGLLPGQVRRIVEISSPLRLPHIAWTEVTPDPAVSDTMFANLTSSENRFYFLHSFSAEGVPDAIIAARAAYEGLPIVAAVRRRALWGTQFHPEKSGSSGQRLLRNFLAYCAARS